MHAAICISGQFRDYTKTLHSFSNLINQFDKCDVFIIYDENEKEQDIKNVKTLLKPVDSKVVKSLSSCSNLNMWYKIKESYLLCKKYYEKNNIKYDIIIRARYDLLFFNKFDFRNFEINKKELYIGTSFNKLFSTLQRITFFVKKFLLDTFFFGSPEIMDYYMNFYNSIAISNNSCLTRNYPEFDFQKYSDVIHTKIIKLPIYYEHFNFHQNFFKYGIFKLLHPNGFRPIYNFKLISIFLIILIFYLLYTSNC
jgi:hypothetical protein